MDERGIEAPAVERRSNEPASLRLRTLSAALTVDDLERSRRFYVDGLGFIVRERWEDEGKLLGLDLVAGACSLGISQDDWAKGRERGKGVGFRLFAETGQDLEALARRFRDNGIEVDGPKTEPWGMRTVTVVDPDGFKLTLHGS
ncbi:MAG TPA: VOC family protein [Thermoanaerobaculia bacterium]|nr:VOC family protein [Thermoanaerobaculia bacterium]